MPSPAFSVVLRGAALLLAWSLQLPAIATAPAPVSASVPVPRLGRALTAPELAAAGSSIYPDGSGLPDGSGDASAGKRVFAQHCARCHGAAGRGGSAPELAGGSAALNSPHPDRTIGLFWPYAATLFDFIWRAMPMDKPGSLSVDDAYAVTAYLLFAEGLISESERMNPTTLPAVRMPNRDGFRAVGAPPGAIPRPGKRPVQGAASEPAQR